MKILFLLFLVLSLVAPAATAQPTTAPAPGPKVITTSGTYTGTYSEVVITAGAPADVIILDHVIASSITSNTPCTLTIRNCTISSPFESYNSAYGIVVWRFVNVDIEHNLLNGTGGIMVRDFSGQAKTCRVCFNRGINISGATSAHNRDKRSFIQAEQLHLAGMEFGWNWVTNTRGESATEDGISFMASGGTAASYATMHDNFVDGSFNWPIGGNFSGSGCMAYDPGSGSEMTCGGYTTINNNFIVATENAGLDCAGSHDIKILNNVVCNDGTTTTITVVPMRTWNWGLDPTHPGTAPGSYGPFTATGNQTYWLDKGNPCKYEWAKPQTAESNNTYPVLTDAGVRAMWADKVKTSGYTIGPVPAATATMSGMAFTAASPGVQLVPLPSESLGPPTACGYTVAGSWVQYPQVDFGDGVTSVTVNLATKLAGQTFTIHADSQTGPLIATVTCPKENGWYAYAPVTAAAGNVTGIHSVVLVFAGSANIQGFAFK
jgi:hypothetical protein